MKREEAKDQLRSIISECGDECYLEHNSFDVIERVNEIVDSIFDDFEKRGIFPKFKVGQEVWDAENRLWTIEGISIEDEAGNFTYDIIRDDEDCKIKGAQVCGYATETQLRAA